MNYISMCSGIEAASAAWIPLGWVPVAFSEIEKFPSRVLAHHHPNVPNHGDFTAFDWSIYRGAVDVLVAGTPCQAFSVAGLRQSLADHRGNLTLEFIRAADAIRPRYIVWENVPGVLSTKDNAFGHFLSGLVGGNEALAPKQRWPRAGVVHGPTRRAAWRVLDAQYFGLAQRRKRVFVVASAGDGADPAEILLEWESLRRDTPPRREAGQGATRGFEIGPSGGSESTVSPTRDSRAQDGPIRNQIAPCMLYNAEGSEGATLTKSNIGNHLNNQTPIVVHPLPAIGVDEEQNAAIDLMGTLKSRTLGGGQEAFVATLAIRNDGTANTPLTAMAVRRLTPRECERLQGFPDDYTLIPDYSSTATGKYGGNKGIADGPRYKALGNSMAVPVMRWIGERIEKIDSLHRNRVVPWIECPSCDEFYCTIHKEHVADCACPPVDVWAEYDLWPYALCGLEDVNTMLMENPANE